MDSPNTAIEALSAVATFTTKVRSLILNTTDGIKIAGLADKAREAFIYLNNPYSDPDELILEALRIEVLERNRGETPEELARAIIAKAARVRQFRAKIDGLEDRFKTAIEMSPNDATAVATFTAGRAFAIGELSKLGIPLATLEAL